MSSNPKQGVGEPLIEIVEFDENEIENIQRDQWERSQAKKKGKGNK